MTPDKDITNSTTGHKTSPNQRYHQSTYPAQMAIGNAARIAILCPRGRFAETITRVAGITGAEVHQCSSDISPAKALTYLEQVKPECAVLPAWVLRGLPSHPAAALSDLTGLSRVIYDAGENLSAGECEAVKAAFGVEVIGLVDNGTGLESVEQNLRQTRRQATMIAEQAAKHPDVGSAAAYPLAGHGWALLAVPAECPDGEPQSQRWVEQTIAETTAAIETGLSGLDLREAVAAIEGLGQTALLSMLNAFRRCGLFTHQDAHHTEDEVLAKIQVAAAHRPLIRRWIKVLCSQGLLHTENGNLGVEAPVGDFSDAALAKAWHEVEEAWIATVGSANTIDYARRNARQLPELISGATSAVHLLFQEGRTDLARALYREAITARYQHGTVRALVSRIARRWQSREPIRLLEIGAGTGATSEAVLPALADLNVDYLFTDVSRYFLDQAEPLLSRYPNVRQGLYDIDEPPQTQGFAPNSFDIIIGGGVLNAAQNTDASIRWLTEMLAPGGWLVLTEPTTEEYWVMASQAFMLSNASDERAETESTFLSHSQWIRVFDDAGLHRVLDLPDDEHPLARLGHRVFAARAKTDRALLTPNMLKAYLGDQLRAAPLHIEIVDQMPPAWTTLAPLTPIQINGGNQDDR